MDNPSNDFLVMFLTTANENVAGMQKILFSQEATNPSTLEELHRRAHSLKGEFAALGFNHSARLSYLLEMIFASVQKGTTILSPAYIPLLEKSLEHLSSSLNSIKTTKSELDLDSWTEELSRGTGITLPEESAI